MPKQKHGSQPAGLSARRLKKPGRHSSQNSPHTCACLRNHNKFRLQTKNTRASSQVTSGPLLQWDNGHSLNERRPYNVSNFRGHRQLSNRSRRLVVTSAHYAGWSETFRFSSDFENFVFQSILVLLSKQPKNAVLMSRVPFGMPSQFTRPLQPQSQPQQQRISIT